MKSGLTPLARRLAVLCCLAFGPPGTTWAEAAREGQHWPGLYMGLLPCAECEGIVTLLELSPEGQYRLRELYSGRSETAFVSTGAFHWDASGEVITLDGMSPLRLYKVGAGRLWALDLAGQVIKGGLAERYVLTKAE